MDISIRFELGQSSQLTQVDGGGGRAYLLCPTLGHISFFQEYLHVFPPYH